MPTWYDESTPAGFYPMEVLALFDRQYISLFIAYLQSSIVSQEDEPICISELVFEIYEKYSWCLECLQLIVTRLKKKSGFGEFSIQETKQLMAERGVPVRL